MMDRKKGMFRLFKYVVLGLSLTLSPSVFANIIIIGTRIVYPEGNKEVTVKINNEGKQPSLVQVWSDKGNNKSTPETADAPFLIMPPIFRVESHKSQTLRITYTGEELPQDRESLFWLNVLDVPPMPIKTGFTDKNYLQIAIRTRIKIFFRPKGLVDTQSVAAEQIKWSIVKSNQNSSRYALKATNASPYYITISDAALTTNSHQYIAKAHMLEPGQTSNFPLNGLSSLPQGKNIITYTTINDLGGTNKHSFKLP
ncbi:MAG: putative fimbrial chaperone YadV [Legionellaceae bacterium]